ncbi:DUF134 domain-containing protein [Zongyangia hominis]|uniref:DUF134 domain-containing protein n=1 Tax=Zongyangia hominis TaxID=2763677 RepID=A0A926EEM8_9FIRM|nr:DUF134 domain-containing protein [Zongyangia hominis]MBC8570327.1 DUF134 domain-containing protein [Zongyangia hominis]
MPKSKCRRVCAEPEKFCFVPENGTGEENRLSVDELESLRLCDLEGMDQDTAAQRMGVSRGTFQRILYAARKQVADALCHGKSIRIGGGNYQVAQTECQCPGVCARCRFLSDEKPKELE